VIQLINSFTAQGGGSEVLVNTRQFAQFANFTLVEVGTADGEKLQEWIEKYGNITVHIPMGGMPGFHRMRFFVGIPN